MSLRKIAVDAVVTSPLPRLLLRNKSKSRATVLLYHRVAPEPEPGYPFSVDLFEATPEQFATDVNELRRDMDIISIKELIAGFEDPKLMPARPLCITFDDGYSDTAKYTSPILREAGVSACHFLATSFVGTNRLPWYEQVSCCFRRSRVKEVSSPFGAEDAPFLTSEPLCLKSIRDYSRRIEKQRWSLVDGFIERLKDETGVNPEEHAVSPLYMSWNTARELISGGLELGGHTRTHPILSMVDDASRLQDEIAGCSQDIIRETGQTPLAFAYPSGTITAMSQQANAEIAAAGFKAAFATMHSVAPRRPRDLFRVPRMYGSRDSSFRTITWELARARVLD